MIPSPMVNNHMGPSSGENTVVCQESIVAV